MRVPHWIVDGTGMVMLMGELMRNLAEADKGEIDMIWGEEVSRLAPNLEQVLHGDSRLLPQTPRSQCKT